MEDLAMVASVCSEITVILGALPPLTLAAAQGAVSSLRIGPCSDGAMLGVGCKYALWGVRA